MDSGSPLTEVKPTERPLHPVDTEESKVLHGGTEPLLSPSATAMFQPATKLAACALCGMWGA